MKDKENKRWNGVFELKNFLNLNLTTEDNAIIASYRESVNEDAGFYAMDMEPINTADAMESLQKGELEAIVCDKGIIGYAFKGNAEEIATALSLKAIEGQSR